MGNYKFRLSDMMPNAWFYKLKDMSTKPRNHTTSNNKKHISSSKPKPKPTPHQHFIQHRNSYYIQTNEAYISSDKLYNSPINPKVSDVHFPDQPRKSSKTKSRRRPNTKLVSSSVSAGCICRATMDSVSAKTDSISTPDSSTPTSPENTLHESSIPESGSDPVSSSLSSSCSCKMTSSPTDIIIDVNETNKASSYKFDGLESISELELPPILTKPAKFNYTIAGIKNREAEQEEETFRVRRSCSKLEEKIVRVVKEESVKPRKHNRTSPRCSATSPGLKLRGNSPKIASKKIQAYSRKSTVSSTTKTGQVLSRRKRIAESFAIVKSSFDPQRDFRESMVEMIVENNIRASKDLEELLACYLSLNSNEYHDLIVKVFEQIWFDLTAIHL